MDDSVRVPRAFLAQLLEAHRPEIRQMSEALDRRLKDLRCPSCDGHRWRVVALGIETVPECVIWRQAKELGLISDEDKPGG
ncbi:MULTISPECIES: hypothetical protein [Streptomyces]|uniref:hypothetical protein n=1 Tax=Streptomyces TaxID=1883 RepID=UPI00345B6F10